MSAPEISTPIAGESGPFAVPNEAASRLYLFSVDLEDIRKLIPDGDQYSERVPANTARFIEFLADHDMHCTFYTTGDVARRYPELIRDIVEAGHEVGCHTSDHLPLDRHTPETFREDIARCLDDFAKAGAETCTGFRAPIGSLIKETRWAYGVLSDLGFTYSSSVVPAANPLYGWPDFGPDLPQIIDDIWELPTSLSHIPRLNVPFSGGIYFRVLPFTLVRYLAARRSATGFPVFGYVHPYDIDLEQERYMHPELNDNRFYNWLMYVNRRRVLPRVDRLIAAGYEIVRYDEYVADFLVGKPRQAQPRTLRSTH